MFRFGPPAHTLPNQAHTQSNHIPVAVVMVSEFAMGHGAYVFVKLLNIMAMECHSDAPEHEETWRG